MAASTASGGILIAVVPLLAVTVADSSAAVGVVAAAGWLPWIMFALGAGSLVDRYDRRMLMRNLQTARLALLAILAGIIVLEQLSVWVLFAVTFALGAIEVVYNTAAEAFLPSVVGKDKLVTGNSRLFVAELTANRLVGPYIWPAAGWLGSRRLDRSRSGRQAGPARRTRQRHRGLLADRRSSVRAARCRPAHRHGTGPADGYRVPRLHQQHSRTVVASGDGSTGGARPGQRKLPVHAYCTLPLGATLGGVLADAYGVRTVFLLGGILVSAAGAVVAPVLVGYRDPVGGTDERPA